ncbi:MAG: ketoacyl-ACP synthase III [Ignavibacteriae bacterium]|nr:ketoacyl-ACP synthase III [Ignavibacteriota bacterium]
MNALKINQINIKGISVCVPKNEESNYDLSILNDDEKEQLINTTGISKRRISNPSTCTSDLCKVAAEDVIGNMNIEKKDIGILIMVSQTFDYIIPSTSNYLQYELGLGQDTICIDVNMGCAGYIYGLYLASNLLKNSSKGTALLLCGDTISKVVSKTDRSTYPLFGDAGSATILEKKDSSDYFYYLLKSDGSKNDAIKIKSGFRNGFSRDSFDLNNYGEGINRNDFNLFLNGVDVFNFSIREVPKAVNELLVFANKCIGDIDYFIFHQANKIMNEMIRKKLKLPEEKVPYSLGNYGNTSSATIPLTIVSNLNGKLGYENTLLLSGFGVGLSWGTSIIKVNNLYTSNVLECDK